MSHPCVVTGEVLVGDERIVIDALGWRGEDHGVPDWTRWSRRTGHWADGTPLTSTDQDVVVTPVHEAPVLAGAGDGAFVRLSRSLCRLTGPGGRSGAGWWERLHPVEGELVE